MHVHVHDYVVVPLVDDTMFVTNADGSEQRDELRIGQSYARPAGIEHSVANRGTASIAADLSAAETLSVPQRDCRERVPR